MHPSQVWEQLIVLWCSHFEAYKNGKDVVHVETDHLSWEEIVQKPLYNISSQLQRMLLQLQKFNLSVWYKKSKEMLLTVTLNRAHFTDVHMWKFAWELEAIDHTASASVQLVG